MEREGIYQRIIQDYKITGSVKKTAENLNTYPIRVRRVLITEGLWQSRTSQEIGGLFQKGLTVREIAAQLYLSEKDVQSYLPYQRGQYGKEKRSGEAVRSELYRERMHHAAERQVNMKNESSFQDEKQDGTFVEKATHLQNQLSEHKPAALQIHLELNDLDDLDEEGWNILRKYGHVENGISRDILVPADMTLHGLHYAIMKLFGWQNSHLHSYRLPEADFAAMTGGMVKAWARLCGVYFRFPDEDFEDKCWDDDYSGKTSINTWLKKKYCGPYRYGGRGEYYLENQAIAQNFLKSHEEFDIVESFASFRESKRKSPRILKTIPAREASLAELNDSIAFGEDFNYLLERFPISCYLLPNGEKISLNQDFDANLSDQIKKHEDTLEQDLEDLIVVRRLIEKAYQKQHFVSAKQDAENKADAERVYQRLVSETTILPIPVSTMLAYTYDFGDNWKISITCPEMYYQEGDRFIDSCEKPAEETRIDLIQSVVREKKPLCIHRDGMNLVDDVGGVSGFCDFLAEVYGNNDPDNSEEYREWARGLGWTGRFSKPETML